MVPISHVGPHVLRRGMRGRCAALPQRLSAQTSPAVEHWPRLNRVALERVCFAPSDSPPAGAAGGSAAVTAGLQTHQPRPSAWWRRAPGHQCNSPKYQMFSAATFQSVVHSAYQARGPANASTGARPRSDIFQHTPSPCIHHAYQCVVYMSYRAAALCTRRGPPLVPRNVLAGPPAESEAVLTRTHPYNETI